MIKMRVVGVTLDPVTNVPIIILKDSKDEKTLPIWIGIFEASAIALKLEGIHTPRPLTHDLLRSVIENLNAKVTRIVINDLKDNIFYAKIFIRVGRKTIQVDSRPSDAIALALRTEAPIYVEEKVIEKLQKEEVQPASSEDIKSLLEGIDSEDLGKYKM
ncbi:MAG TPA: bifunctional nuclease family protein [bacterium]|nr:MAG: bifunctional nuclease family protein [Thermoprotei archaeon]HDO71305.1 bifunctional nuclease family protein [bacterium]HEX68313.1 bifunctional nuclease family protein [bacterium]